MWIASSIGFFKRHNLLKNAMWQLIIGTIICFIWDALTGWHSWSVDLVLPIMSVSTLAAMFVTANLAFMRGGEKSNSEYVWSIDVFLIPCSSNFVQGKRI